MTVAVDAAHGEWADDERVDSDPYAGDRIELEENQLRTLSPGGWLVGLSSRVDDAVARFTWER